MMGKSLFWTVLLLVLSWVILGAVAVENLHLQREIDVVKAAAREEVKACNAKVERVIREQDDLKVALRLAIEKAAYWQSRAATDCASRTESRKAPWDGGAFGVIGLLLGGATAALVFGSFRAGFRLQTPIVRGARGATDTHEAGS